MMNDAEQDKGLRLRSRKKGDRVAVVDAESLRNALADLALDEEIRKAAIRRILEKLGPLSPYENGIYVGNMYTLAALKIDLLRALGEDA